MVVGGLLSLAGAAPPVAAPADSVACAAFEAAAARLCDRWLRLQTTLRDTSSQSAAVAAILTAIVNFALALGVLALLGADVSSAFATAASLLLGVVYALGESTRKLIESLAFLILRAPYDTGSRVVLSDNPRRILVVRRIRILTTCFLTLRGERVTYPNHALFAMTIENHRRSGPPSFQVGLDVLLAAATPARVLGAEAELAAWLRARPQDWRAPESACLTVGGPSLGAAHCVRLTLSAATSAQQQQEGWQEGRRAYARRSQLIYAALAALERRGLVPVSRPALELADFGFV